MHDGTSRRGVGGDLSSSRFATESVLEEPLGGANGLFRTNGADALVAGPLVIGHGDGLEKRQGDEGLLELFVGGLLEEALELCFEHVHSWEGDAQEQRPVGVL